ncbi:hypothetical protein BBP40_009507 [Aspergillus hancockii]|nr:hypothetical protein BBP40_009507 [Aspergillus hancockii]
MSAETIGSHLILPSAILPHCGRQKRCPSATGYLRQNLVSNTRLNEPVIKTSGKLPPRSSLCARYNNAVQRAMWADRLVVPLWLLFLCATPVSAQYVVSSTAAWSSQIIAFWGAIVIAAHVGKVASAATSIFSNVRRTIRARAIANALTRGNWFLHSGWNNGRVRTDIAVVCWSSPAELQDLARRVAIQIETFGAAQWQVLVVGRQLKKGQDPVQDKQGASQPAAASQDGLVRWIRCPRTERFCGTKVKETDENLFPLNNQDLQDGLDMLDSSPPLPAEDIVREMNRRRDSRASRGTYLSEQHQEMQVNSAQLSWGYIFTGVEHHLTPYLKLAKWSSPYGADRGLMAAATGRGLAVWLLTVRPTISSMGGKNVNGDDALQSLLCMDGCAYQYETDDGSPSLAGDVLAHRLPWRHSALAFAIPVLEMAIIIAGWLYGSLKADRLEPSGVVGHGMLWLSIVVGLLLGTRCLLNLRNQGKGRLVGIWRRSQYVQYTIGMESLEISVSDLLRIAGDSSPLGLLIRLIRDSEGEDSIKVVESLLRLPLLAALLEYLTATEILSYKYQDDEIITRGGKAISPQSVSPWRQSYCCVAITMACACMSAVYAYYPLPKWAKLVAEVLLAISALWFNSIDLVGSFMHDKETSICFMVATLVVSSVWYVGLDNVG